MHTLLHTLAALALTLISVGDSASAQERAPKSFYKKDYASAPGAEGREEEAQAPRPTRASTTKSRSSTSVTHPTPKAEEKKDVKRRVVISVIVNSKDREHLQKVLDEVYKLHDEKRAFITSVEHIGEYSSITPEIEEELKRRSIDLRATSTPSHDAHLTTSPAWVLLTTQGAHIAEGIIQISSFLNEYGEYEPRKVPDPTSTHKVEEF